MNILYIRSPVGLRPSVRPVVASNHRNARSIVGNHVRRTVRRTNGLRGNQHNIDELTDEHEAERAEFHQTDGRIAKVKSVHTEHAEENRQQQSRVEVVSVSSTTTKTHTNKENYCQIA